MIRLQTILCPTDFSESSTEALEVALELACSFGSSIWLVHVIEPPILFGAELSSSGLVAEMVKVEHERAEALLAREVERCRALGIAARSQLETGAASFTLIEFSHHVDLIVMGTHGRTGFQHLVMGSIAERVLRGSRCPVLVVPLLSAGTASAAA